jgi:pectate disaccharide-lyase
MKKSVLPFGLCALLALGTGSLFAQDARKAWSDVAAPEITGIALTPDNPNEISVQFKMLTSTDGADIGSIVMTAAGGQNTTNTVGKTRKEEKHAEFQPAASGVYTFTVYAERKGESVRHASESKSFPFSLPLTKPALSLLNKGNGAIEARWTAVQEAEGYILSYTDAAGKTISLPQTKDLAATISGLTPESYSDISVAAVRKDESSSSITIHKLVKAAAEREWKFTEFGTSTDPAINRMEMIDPNNLKFKLYSCTFDPATGNIDKKGGKFTAFFDGVSYYYTVIDPGKENFELTATVNVDYMNPMPDGQEGFGLLAMDSLGQDGKNMIIHYTNSAGVLSFKYTTHVNGAKKEIRDGLGARFVSGISPSVISMGDSGIAQNGVNFSEAFSYDQASDAIKTGDVYRITLKKDNTGYHAIYKRAIPSEGTIEEYTMYDPSKLLQLDKDHVYVGFVVARGCNATFSDIAFTTSDPQTDPPAVEEPPQLIPLTAVVDSPSTWHDGSYPFVFCSNSNGSIHVETTDGDVLIDNDPVTANNDYQKILKIEQSSITDMLVTFTPQDGFRPQPKQVIAQYNKTTGAYEKNYQPVTQMLSVISMTYSGKNLYVTPEGTAFGKGTKADPLDITSAINYAKPGQTIILESGTYFMKRVVRIEKGNDGTAKQRITLKCEDPVKHAVFNFSGASAGFELYGNYWTLENIDVTKTIGDVKGLQVYGSYNILTRVDAYENGDTGIQISGRSMDPPAKWPHDNLIQYCESFGNCDPAQNNADGFGAKLTTGERNVFKNCVSHHNVDDGWDLYAKVETGPIGAVLIEDCITYKNGTKLDGTGKGDGNGFKMGGDGIAVKHILRNSISWGNGANGITCNSNPALILDHVTSFGNGNYNINLYGKGKAEDYPRTFITTGIISMNGGAGDDYKERPDLLADDTYFFNGAATQNKSGKTLDKSVFASVDTSRFDAGLHADGSYNRIPRSANGTFDLGTLFKLTSSAPADAGARLPQ